MRRCTCGSSQCAFSLQSRLGEIMVRKIKFVAIALAFYLLGIGTTSAVAQGRLTLEGLAEGLAALAGRVDGVEERLATLEAKPRPIAATAGSIAPGMYKIGVDISPGEYTGVAGDELCYWARLSSLGGKVSDVIANDLVEENSRFYVEIEESDYAFEIAGCSVSPVILSERETPSPTATRRRLPTPRPTSTPRPRPTPQANTITIMRTSNVRSGPGTNYAVVGQSDIGTVYKVTGRNAAGDWYRIDYSGQPAWIWTGLTDNRNLSVPVVRTPVPPPTRQPVPTQPSEPPPGAQTIIIDKTRQSYWAAPSNHGLSPGPGKYAVPPGEYVYVCTKTNNNFWHKILVPGAPDGWVWIRAVVFFLDEVYCDQ